MTVILLFVVSVAPVNAADNNVTSAPESIASGTAFVALREIAVETDGGIVVADAGLDAVVRAGRRRFFDLHLLLHVLIFFMYE